MLPSREVPTASPRYALAPCAGPPTEGERCRCGTQLGPGTGCFQFARVPHALADVLDHQRFCGPACARAFILEALELIDAAPLTPALRDLEDMGVAFRFLLAVMALQASAPATFGTTEAPVVIESAERDS